MRNYAAVRTYGLKHRSIILPVVLYGSQTWSLAMREEHRIGMFENRVLRIILGHQTEEVTWNGDSFVMRKFMI
jgi:hypothetical protein